MVLFSRVQTIGSRCVDLPVLFGQPRSTVSTMAKAMTPTRGISGGRRRLFRALPVGTAAHGSDAASAARDAPRVRRARRKTGGMSCLSAKQGHLRRQPHGHNSEEWFKWLAV